MTNVVDPNNDNFPPGRVTDLSVFNLGNDLSLSFTSPGDDLDSVDHVAEYIIKYSSTAGNLSGSNFDNESFNNMIQAGDLLDSDLTPVNGGTLKEIRIRKSIFIAGKKYVFAMVASDEVGNKSPVSNIVQVLVSVSNNAAIPQLMGKIAMSCIVLICIFLS